MYICSLTDEGVEGETDVDVGRSLLRGLCATKTTLSDSTLKKIYSMDIKDGLLSSGGGDGRVSVYGFGSIQQSDVGDEEKVVDPLSSFKAHSGWISSVKFITQGCSTNSFLLTSSNDMKVALWDLRKQNIKNGVPIQVTSSSSIHSQGVFSMDAQRNKFVTGSKDTTVALSVIAEGSISTTRLFSNIHTHIVKSVNMRDENIFASAGNDMTIQVIDVRQPDDSTAVCSITESGHDKVINSVRWNSYNSNILCSTSFDEKIQVWDIRSTATPLFSLSGHSHGYGSAKKNKIYHPVYVANGTCLLSPGLGGSSEYLTLFSLMDGNVISKGYVGYDTTALQVDEASSQKTKVLAAHCQYISLLHGVLGASS